jgi:hypothetical protein
MRLNRQAVVLALALVSSPRLRAGELDGFGPLYDHFRLTLGEGERTEALGPFLSWEREGSARSWALSPLWSYRRDPATDFTELDVLYPVMTFDRFGLDYRVHFMQLFSLAGGHTMDMTAKRRVTLFPVYFQQRSPDPELNYTAVVPFYGHLKNRFFRDEISFVMLPAYLQSRKGDVITDNYLFPFFHLRRGEGLHGWQFWPLAGHEHKIVTTETNLYHETEFVGGHDKLFVLWPFFIKNDLGLGTTNVQTQRLFIPFYTAQRSPLRDSATYLWPFGYTYTEDREHNYREWALPWPIIGFARGQGKTLNRVWPLFSQGKTPTLESDFYLWPLYKYTHLQSAPLDRERTRILFFLYSDLAERNTAAGTTMRRTDLWPFFTARRDHNGHQRLQLFAPVEPLLPANPGIEHNYTPLWSIWRSESNAKTGAASQSFLWNLYRRDTTPASRKCSLLFGLFRYQSGPEGKRWRVLFVPFGAKASTPAAQGTRIDYVPESR